MPSLFTRRARTLAFLAFVAAAIAGRQYTSAQERALPGTLPHADVGHAGAANDGDERMYWGGRPPGASGWPGFPGGPSRPPQNRYQLGVRVKNSPTGVLIKEVVKGSPAAEARLSEGDRILSVAGHQVGYIDDRLVDLGDEINLHTGRDGRVTLLVYSARGALQNVTVSFKDASGAISGVAVYKGDLRLTQQAVLNVRLLDVSHNHWTGVVVASSSYPRANRTPFNFDFVVDSSRLYPNHRYTFEAEVVDQRGVVLRTPDPVAYDPRSNQIALILGPPRRPGFSDNGPAGYDPSLRSAAPQSAGTPQPLTVAGPRVNPEDLAPRDQVTYWYQKYLDRDPTPQELATWQNHLNRGQSIRDVQSYLLGGSEYFDRSHNDADEYVQAVHRELNGSNPTPTQMQQWRRQYDQSSGVRSSFVQQLLGAPKPQ